MDTISEADNTTVVGSWPRDGSGGSKPVYSKGKETNGEFLPHQDYLSESRPFFVNVGKDGLIAALQKLNTELRNVECQVFIFDSSAEQPPQSGRPGVLSRKVRFLRCNPLHY
jgi:hypothetical protein